MSHGNMTVAQAKELQSRLGGRVITVGLKGDRKTSHYKATDRAEDFHIALNRDGDHNFDGKTTVVVMKSRKTQTGIESKVIQKFDL